MSAGPDRITQLFLFLGHRLPVDPDRVSDFVLTDRFAGVLCSYHGTQHGSDQLGGDGLYRPAWISKYGVLGVHVFPECRWYMFLATV